MQASDIVSETRLSAGSRGQQRRTGFGPDLPRTLSLAAIMAVSCAFWLVIWWVATQL